MNSYKLERTRKKINVFLKHLSNIAELSESSKLKVGAIAIKNNFQRDVFGYNGSVPNAEILKVTGTEEESLEPGLSGFVHAEMNLIAKFREIDPENYVVILTHSPCSICSKLLINAEFKNIFWVNEYRETSHINRDFNGRVENYGTVEELMNSDELIRNVFVN